MFNQRLFCERLRALRQERGLSQEQLGDALGLSKPAISDIERGRRTTTIEKLASMALFLNVSSDYLLGISDDSKRY